MVSKECLRILSQIEVAKSATWDKAVLNTDLNGLVLKNVLLAELANELRNVVLKVFFISCWLGSID